MGSHEPVHGWAGGRDNVQEEHQDQEDECGDEERQRAQHGVEREGHERKEHAYADAELKVHPLYQYNCDCKRRSVRVSFGACE